MLDDVLAEDLFVVFSGTAVPDRTVKVEAYYASRGNKFWSVLFRTRLTPRQLRPEEYTALLAHDLGLVDLVKLRSSIEPGKDDDFDVRGFRKKIAEHKPAIVAFNGKEAAKRCFGVETIPYGRSKSTVEGSVVYVLPSTADKAHEYWDESQWQALADEVRKLRKGR